MMKFSSLNSFSLNAQQPAFAGLSKRKSNEWAEGETSAEESKAKKPRRSERLAQLEANPYHSPATRAAIQQLQHRETLTDTFVSRLKNPQDEAMKQLVQDLISHQAYPERETLLSRLIRQLARSKNSGGKQSAEDAALRLNILRLPREIQEKILLHKLDLHPKIWLDTMDSVLEQRPSQLTKPQLRDLHLLTRHGGSLNQYLRKGGTVLSESMQVRHEKRSMFDYFMQFPPKRLPLNQLDEVHLTALDRAVMMGFKSAANELLAKGETITPQTLKQAALWGEPELLQGLLKRSELNLSEEQVAQLTDKADRQHDMIQALRPLGTEPVQLVYKARLAGYINDAFGQAPFDLEQIEANFAVLAKSNADIEEKDEELGMNPLHLAAMKGHAGIAKMLLRAGVNVNKRDGDKSTALHLAAESGQEQLVKLLLTAKADPNAEDVRQATPMHMAAQRGHSGVFYDLLGMGGQVTAKDYTGDSMLHYAANGGNPDIIETVLQAGIPVNQGGEFGFTALSAAAGRGHLPAVEKLLAWGADPNKRAQYGGAPLHAASRIGRLDIVDRLLAAGALTDKWDSLGNSVLHSAVESRNPQLVDRFIQLGVPVNSEAMDGRTPLHVAAMAGDLSSISRLIRAGADINKTERYGHSPLFFAVMGENSRAVAALLMAGAKVDHWEHKDLSSGNVVTPLHYAAEHGDLAMVKLLLQAGANPAIGDTLVRAAKNSNPQIMQYLLSKRFPRNQKDEFGMNALHMAAFCRNIPVLQMLMKSGFSVKTLDDHQGSALHWAAQGGSVEMVQALLNAGAPVDQVNDEGETAIHRAVKYFHPNPTVPLLIRAGVPLNVKDKDGHTALYYATRRHDPEAEQALREHGAVMAS